MIKNWRVTTLLGILLLGLLLATCTKDDKDAKQGSDTLTLPDQAEDKRGLQLEEDLENLLAKTAFEKEHFRTLSEMTLAFSKARSEGNIKNFQDLLAPSMAIEERSGELWAVYEQEGTRLENILFLKKRHNMYVDMNLIYFDYDPKSQIYQMGCQEFLYDIEDQSQGMGFVYLYFKLFEGKWKIVAFEYDI